jgi:ethanolamine ammonia-lyase small subunit
MSDSLDRSRLRAYTNARVGLRRAGASLATSELLDTALCLAEARDAVHAALGVVSLRRQLEERGRQIFSVASAAHDRAEYLRRPDLGRQLSPGSRSLLAHAGIGSSDLVIVIADGLSAMAAERHAVPVLDALFPLLDGWRIGPIATAEQARVAIGDEIGQILQGSATLVLIGERPGLSSPDSLGAYITWAPRVGRNDAERNCISNIRPEGLDYQLAAAKIASYLTQAQRLQMTGIALKEESFRLPD